MGQQLPLDRHLDPSDYRLLKLMVEDAAAEMSRAQIAELVETLNDILRGRPAPTETSRSFKPAEPAAPASARWRFAPRDDAV